MNFKIESNYLDITNYPSIERHFEKMARKGWLINRIIAGNLFFYKKIQPEELDFSIALYEVETAFTRKSKEELDEFNSVCQSVGWNYATKSFDIHIYFKEKDSEAMAIQTDEEEEFRTLEFIGKKYIKSYYVQIPFILLLSCMVIGSFINNVYSIKDGLSQIVAPLMPLGLILLLVQLFHIKKFLKINRKNIEMGKSIEYSESKFNLYKIAFALIYIIVFILIIYVLYLGIFMKKGFLLLAFLPVIIGLTIGSVYRFIVKPSKIKKRNKIIGFILTIFAATAISIFVSIGSISNMTNQEDEENKLEDEGNLMERVSILIPRSYEYYSYAKKEGSIITEYSKALTERLASNLVDRYIRQAKSASVGRYSQEMKYYLEEGIYDDYLLRGGITKEDFHELKEMDKKDANKAFVKLIKERAITEDEENLWNVDEAYFLSYDKMEVVIRKGKEVFYLDGQDFSDIEIINITKERLDLK